MLKLENSLVVLIDMQGKLWNVMFEKEALLENAQKLVKGLQVLKIPLVMTEQNPRGLGPTMPEILQLAPEAKPLAKNCFSGCQDPAFRQSLAGFKARQVLVAGIEAHICVYQTCLDLLEDGYKVQVIADCVSSRTQRNRDISLGRMQSEGIKITTVEMALFELLKTADSPVFKEISRIIR